MLSIFRKAEQTLAIESLSLEELLDELQRYGEPRLARHDKIGQQSGTPWLCTLQARLTATGVSFEAQAWQATPRAAARKCLENLLNAVAGMGAR